MNISDYQAITEV